MVNSTAALGPLGPGYTIRRLLPCDAHGVSACVRQVYGDSYVHPELYDPDEILRLNQSGELVSAVTLDSAGQVVAHYGLERPGLTTIAETGEAMVLPEHRHHQLMERMREVLEAEAQRLELQGLFGHVVTNHVYSQRTVERFGESPCAVNLGWSPRSFHNMPEPLPQRMSELLYFKHLRPPEPRVVYLPDQHREICIRIYDRLGIVCDVGRPQPPVGGGALDLDYHDQLQRGVIRVRRVGSATVGEVVDAREALRRREAEALFVELPLSQPATVELCEQLEARGFCFSGIGPCFAADGDALILQWLGVELDVALLEIESPAARELVDYVAEQRQCAAAGQRE